MKKLFLVLAVLILTFGCSKETQNEDLEFNVETTINNRNHKVDVCHTKGNGTWHVINISANALPAHLAHGDVLLEDNDGDGFVAELNECVPGGDCDDTDATTYPGAEEICGDGIDNNCDGQIDEDCCPCFSLDDVLAESNTGYFDTNGASYCYFDGTGFFNGSCLYGVSYDRFLCVSPDGCTVTNSISAADKASCIAIIQQARAMLNLPELCTGSATDPNQNRNLGVEGPFLMQ